MRIYKVKQNREVRQGSIESLRGSWLGLCLDQCSLSCPVDVMGGRITVEHSPWKIFCIACTAASQPTSCPAHNWEDPTASWMSSLVCGGWPLPWCGRWSPQYQWGKLQGICSRELTGRLHGSCARLTGSTAVVHMCQVIQLRGGASEGFAQVSPSLWVPSKWASTSLELNSDQQDNLSV